MQLTYFSFRSSNQAFGREHSVKEFIVYGESLSGNILKGNQIAKIEGAVFNTFVMDPPLSVSPYLLEKNSANPISQNMASYLMAKSGELPVRQRMYVGAECFALKNMPTIAVEEFLVSLEQTFVAATPDINAHLKGMNLFLCSLYDSQAKRRIEPISLVQESSFERATLTFFLSLEKKPDDQVFIETCCKIYKSDE